MTRVLVTGATGFIGRELCATLARAGFTVRAALRDGSSATAHAAERVVVGDVNATTEWKAALRDVAVVVHAAARAHIRSDAASESELFIETNARGTQRLALAAKGSGIRRLIYLSSIKVNGEETRGHPYSASDEPAPRDAYGVSKWLGERHVLEAAAGSDMRIAIVRPPLVYGPGVKANFLRLLRWVDKQRPLPFGAIQNKRSLVSVWNLCDFLVSLLGVSNTRNRVWMVSDGEDISTPALMRLIGACMHRRMRIFPVPANLLRVLGRMAGRAAELDRLCGSLVVDIEESCAQLRWRPPVALNEGIARTVDWYLREGR
jgi:nucleoside-diphosphate-sugar epimerase